MPAVSFSAIRSTLPPSEWLYSREPNVMAARERFTERLKTYGLSSNEASGTVSERMSSVKTHSDMRSAATDMAASLKRMYPLPNAGCDSNKMLEAAAAFFGFPSWDALSASLPKVRGVVDTADALRDRGFVWTRTGGSLMLGGKDSLDKGWDAEGWLWCRVEPEQEPSRVGMDLQLPYVNIAAYQENWLRLGAPERPPAHDGKVVMEICRDASGEDWCVLDWKDALEAIDSKIYIDWPAWVALKRASGSPEQDSDSYILERRNGIYFSRKP